MTSLSSYYTCTLGEKNTMLGVLPSIDNAMHCMIDADIPPIEGTY